MTRPAQILTFDSGLGGLTVHAELLRACPGAAHVYVADDAVFPYGRLSEKALVARVRELMEVLIAEHRPDIVVIACNTASTLVLPHLRARWPDLPFVGTVPAVIAGGVGTLIVVGLWMKLFPPLRQVNRFVDVSVPL